MTQPTLLTQPTTFATPRLASLDAFRGATIALMVLVNNPGDGAHAYAPLQHAQWHGWTITDAVFPSFLWIVGASIALSRPKPAAQVVRRAAIIFALGLLVYAFPHFNLSTQRILGVLQRIAICYLIAAMIYRWFGVRAQIAWIAGLLAVYWLLMAQKPLDVENNFAHAIDRIVLGAHNYHNTKTWDPEGIVSTLPSIATALLGLMAGHILRLKRELSERTAWLFTAGNILVAAGLICDIWLPINKKLWTSSFALFMAGLDFVLLAGFVWLIDHLGKQRYVRPLVIMGMNSITVYMASELIDEALSALGWREAIYNAVFAPLASPVNASLLYGLAYVALMYAIAYGMYKRNWFWRA